MVPIKNVRSTSICHTPPPGSLLVEGGLLAVADPVHSTISIFCLGLVRDREQELVQCCFPPNVIAYFSTWESLIPYAAYVLIGVATMDHQHTPHAAAAFEAVIQTLKTLPSMPVQDVGVNFMVASVNGTLPWYRVNEETGDLVEGSAFRYVSSRTVVSGKGGTGLLPVKVERSEPPPVVSVRPPTVPLGEIINTVANDETSYITPDKLEDWRARLSAMGDKSRSFKDRYETLKLPGPHRGRQASVPQDVQPDHI